METETPMDVDRERDQADGAIGPVPLNLWCFLGKEGVKKVKTDLPVTTDSCKHTLKSLKEFVCRVVGSVTPEEIALLYTGGELRDDDAVKAATFRPETVLTVIKKKGDPSPPQPNKPLANHQIADVAVDLRTAFVVPKFVSAVTKLGQPDNDMLETILALAPGLKDDPIGLGIIQDLTMIYHLSDFPSLKKLADTRPWVVEGINYMTTYSRNRGRGTADRVGPVYNPLLGEYEDDEDIGNMSPENPPIPGPRVTREQLQAALSTLAGHPVILPDSPDTVPLPTIPSGSNLSRGGDHIGFDRVGSASNSRTGIGGGSSGTSSTSLASNPSASPSQSQITPDLVARAMTTALNSLPPEQREERFNILREQINRIQQGGQAAGNPTSTPAVAPSPPAAAPAATSRHAQYASQLSQMREMGIQDERLSVLALRVSEGDVATAVELIFSGWSGEGADAMDEE